MNARYLITAIGGDVGSSVLRCLCEEFSHESLAGCDITPYVSGCDKVEDFFLVPPYKDKTIYIHEILRKCKELGINHVLPMTEGEIRVFNEYRDIFNSAGIKLMINNPNVLKTAFSKYATAEFIRELGLNSPKTWKYGDKVTEIQYPVIVKPNEGCGSRNVRIINNQQEYRMLGFENDEMIVQEYIGSPEEEYTVGVFSNGNVIKTIGFKRILGFDGMSKMVELVEDEKIDFLAEKIADAFKVTGSINIQMRKRDGEYYIFEINPRISSTVGFRHALGFKDVKWWLDMLDGKADQIVYVPEAIPVVGIRTMNEKIFRWGDNFLQKFKE